MLKINFTQKINVANTAPKNDCGGVSVAFKNVDVNKTSENDAFAKETTPNIDMDSINIYVPGSKVDKVEDIEGVRKNLSEIFERGFLTEEAEAFADKYKKILEIKDKDKFIDAAFEQTKKDFGYENVKVELEKKTHDPKARGGYVVGTIFINPDCGRKEIPKIFAHEFTHMNQEEILIRSTPPEKVYEALFKRTMTSKRKVNTGVARLLANFRTGYLYEYWKEASPSIKRPLPKNANARAGKYLESYINFEHPDSYLDKRYLEDFCEKEAYRKGRLMEAIVRYIESS